MNNKSPADITVTVPYTSREVYDLLLTVTNIDGYVDTGAFAWLLNENQDKYRKVVVASEKYYNNPPKPVYTSVQITLPLAFAWFITGVILGICIGLLIWW